MFRWLLGHDASRALPLVILPPRPWGSAGAQQTHHHDIARPVLDGPKEPQDDHNDVDKVARMGAH